MQENKSTLVLGASLNPLRASNQAALLFQEEDIPVYLYGVREGEINGRTHGGGTCLGREARLHGNQNRDPRPAGGLGRNRSPGSTPICQPTASRSLARQRLELFASTYSETSFYPANSLLHDGEAVVPEREHFIAAQRATIRKLTDEDLI